MRKGMGRGQGSGWKNLRCDDSKRHSLASRGIKTAQKVPLSGYDALSPAEKKKTDAYWERRKPTEQEKSLEREAYDLEWGYSDSIHKIKMEKENSKKIGKELVSKVKELQDLREKRGKKFDMGVLEYDSIKPDVMKLLKKAGVV